MANNRASAQKRAKQNRNQRAALEARTKGQPPKRPSRVAPATAEKLATKSRDAESAGAASGSGSKTGDKPRRERPPRPGDIPVDIATLEGGWFTKVRQVPGGSQVIQASLMTVVVTGMLLFMDLYVSDPAQKAADAAGEDRPKPDLTLLQSQGAVRTAVYLGIPLIAVACALRFSLHPQRRRIWFGAMLVVMLAALLMQFYLVVVGFLGYACYKASKVEGPGESLFRRGRRRAADEPADEAADEDAEV